jgi:hypothetical protein
MNDKHQETRASTAPLILTVPCYGFVVAVPLDGLARSNHAALFTETLSTRLTEKHLRSRQR